MQFHAKKLIYFPKINEFSSIRIQDIVSFKIYTYIKLFIYCKVFKSLIIMKVKRQM